MSTVVDLGGLTPRGFVVDGAAVANRAGWSVSGAGDVNGDGFDDIVIGAPYASLAGANRGAAYVIYGRPGGFGEIDLGNLQPGQGFSIQGNAGGAAPDRLTGMSVSAAGDVNGDGFADIIVAASRPGLLGYGDSPRAYVIFGKASGPATVDLTNLASSDGFQIVGGLENAYYAVFSLAVSDAGDFNGDGFDDLLIGQPYARGDMGAAYVVWGKPSGFGTIDLNALGPSNGFAILGAHNNDTLGSSVSSAGDINGDGLDDIIVGAPGGEAAYVIFGKTSGFGTIDLAHLDPGAGFLIQSNSGTFEGIGHSVSAAGDVNHDGFDDIIVGASGHASGAGAAYVIFGKANGFSTVNLGNLGTAGFVIQGGAAGDGIGFRVSAAGDVNHDGIDDVIIGAPFRHSGNVQLGQAYVVFGTINIAGTISVANLDPSAGFIIANPSTNSWAGYSVSDAGDINHDGFADVIVGAAFDAQDAGRIYVVSGNATLADIDNDFNGDGRSDFLVRNDNGTVTNWLAQAAGGFSANAANFQVNATSDWHIVATGDFNGDGRDDILWRSDAGTVTDWLAAAHGGFSNNWTNFNIHADATWQIIGTGDFNGDGRDDILWRSSDGTITDSLGTASGGFASNSANFTIQATPDWQVIATGDFNGDGRDDILWRSDAGTLTEWIGVANGALVTNYASFTIHVDPTWHIVGTGDFNGDGRQDILWRSDAGQITDWLGTANGGFTNNGSNFLVHADANWQIVGIGDFNGDRRDDILWRSDTGQLSDWFGQASGAIAAGPQNFNTLLAATWHVQDPFL